MQPTLRSAVRALGTELSPQVYRDTLALLAAAPGVRPDGVAVHRDLAYGPDPRHRLDVFTDDGSGRRPVVLYVHGGGFVGGDKVLPGTPYYDNVGGWAVRNGCVGVTMTYRLAPQAPWPAGSEDVALAVEHLSGVVDAFGGDPARIVLVGQSAGAVHVAGYLAGQAGCGPHPGVAGAVLSSGLYDAGAAVDNPLQRAYFGGDPSSWSRCSALSGLLETPVPLLLTVSEFDELGFQRQAALLVDAWRERKGTFPPLSWLWGHNHLTPVLCLGRPGDTLGPLLGRFVAQCTEQGTEQSTEQSTAQGTARPTDGST